MKCLDKTEGITKFKIIKLGKRYWRRIFFKRIVDFEGEGFWGEPASITCLALHVGAVAGEKDAYVHLVSIALQPFEKSIDSVPAFWPEMFIIFLIVRVALYHPAFLFCRERPEWNVERDFCLVRHSEHVHLRLSRYSALPGLDSTFSQGFCGVRDDQVHIDTNRFSEPVANGTGAQGMIVAKESWRRFGQRDVALQALDFIGKWICLSGVKVGGIQNEKLALAIPVGLFTAVGKTLLVFLGASDTILNNQELCQMRRFRGFLNFFETLYFSPD